MRLFGGLLLLCCAALPASSDTWNLGGRKSLLVAQPPSGGGAKAVPVMTVTPSVVSWRAGASGARAAPPSRRSFFPLPLATAAPAR